MPGFAKNLHHQIRKSVDYFWLLLKPWSGVHHPENFHHSFDLVETSKRIACGREQTQPDLSRLLVTLLWRKILGYFAFPPCLRSSMTGQINQITHFYPFNVIANRFRRRRQDDIPFLEPSFSADLCLSK